MNENKEKTWGEELAEYEEGQARRDARNSELSASAGSKRSMTHDQEQLVIELIEKEIKNFDVNAVCPMVQAWADERMSHLEETLRSFRELIS